MNNRDKEPTPTPRTDEAAFSFYENWELRSKSVVMASVARTLETELTAMTAERDALKAELDDIMNARVLAQPGETSTTPENDR